MAFLAPCLKELHGNEHILDIGCGEGKGTADLSKFIPQGSILGIDPSSAMIEWAQKQYSSCEYSNLSFLEGGFLSHSLTDLFDVIVSNCALQHCLNQKQALENLAALLKPKGKLWIMIPAIDNPEWREARKKMNTSKKWSKYFKNYVPRSFFTLDEARALLESSGFTIEKIEKIQTVDPFIDKEEFVNFLRGTFSPQVPKEFEEFFYHELIDEYLRLLPAAKDASGVIQARFGRIEIKAIKGG